MQVHIMYVLAIQIIDVIGKISSSQIANKYVTLFLLRS